jgi:orotidine-5'-phosphate decarboxylase
MKRTAKDRLVVALDVPSLREARQLVNRLHKDVRWFKVGSQLFTACGPRVIEHIKSRGASVFLDLKFHDIPTTVAKAVAAATGLGADIINMHAMGGFEMMEAAATAATEAAARAEIHRPLLLGVTVLTSFDEATYQDVLGTPGRPLGEQVLHLARLAKSAGLDGVVASPQEIALLRRAMEPAFTILTPGIRPAGAAADDQRRLLTPAQAVRQGADFLVVGRPVTQAADPAAAARAIITEIRHALK